MLGQREGAEIASVISPITRASIEERERKAGEGRCERNHNQKHTTAQSQARRRE